jgi:hypothetical protein
MERRRWIITVAAILLLGGGGYGACALGADEVGGQGTYAKGGVDAGTPVPPDMPEVPMPGIETPGYPEHPGMQPPEGELPEVPVEENTPPTDFGHAQIIPTGAGEQCGSIGQTCPAGEACCYPTGHCYPADCQDCCAAILHPPGEPPRITPGGPGPDEL